MVQNWEKIPLWAGQLSRQYSLKTQGLHPIASGTAACYCSSNRVIRMWERWYWEIRGRPVRFLFV